MWINSLGIEQYVNNLFDDVSDGMVVANDGPRAARRRRLVTVNKVAKMVFKKIENLNYAVDLGKSPFVLARRRAGQHRQRQQEAHASSHLAADALPPRELPRDAAQEQLERRRGRSPMRTS